MKTTIVFLLLSFALTIPFLANDEVVKAYEDFIVTFNKQYSKTEYLTNFDTFKSNYVLLKEAAIAHASSNSKAPFTQGVTKFFDTKPEQFASTHLNLTFKDIVDLYASCTDEFDVTGVRPVAEIDYVAKGLVNSVRDQGDCGSCWAFSTVSNIETHYAIREGSLLELSEQQLVDCDVQNYGCSGGKMHLAMEYYQYIKAAYREEYKYTKEMGICNIDAVNAGIFLNVVGCVADHKKDENELLKVVSEFGPVVVAVDATSLFNYKGGIIGTGERNLNHAVNIVGYGEENGVKFWKLRNSWGEDWGEKGYFRLERGKDVLGLSQYVVSIKFWDY